MDAVTAPGLYIDPINKDLCVLGHTTQLLWVTHPSTAKWEAWSQPVQRAKAPRTGLTPPYATQKDRSVHCLHHKAVDIE